MYFSFTDESHTAERWYNTLIRGLSTIFKKNAWNLDLSRWFLGYAGNLRNLVGWFRRLGTKGHYCLFFTENQNPRLGHVYKRNQVTTNFKTERWKQWYTVSLLLCLGSQAFTKIYSWPLKLDFYSNEFTHHSTMITRSLNLENFNGLTFTLTNLLIIPRW